MKQLPIISVCALAWYLWLPSALGLGPPPTVRVVAERPREQDSRPEEHLAWLVLARAEVVVTSRVGYAGRLTAEGEAWRALARSPDAGSHFDRLVREPSVTARAYALIWFREHESARFEVEAQRLIESAHAVPTQRGCLVDPEQSLPSFLSEVRRGDWARDLEAPLLVGSRGSGAT